MKVGGKTRTPAAEISIGEMLFGFNTFTTEPPLDEYDSEYGNNADFRSIWGHNKKGTYSSGDRVFAGAYFGYRNGNMISRIGIDSPWMQELTQNFIHGPYFPIINSPYFDTRRGPATRVFSQGGYLYPFSLYPY
jgi:hypothetical protein